MTGRDVAGEFISATRYAQLPTAVKTQVKRCLLDVLGATLGGAATPVARVVSDFVRQEHGGDEATILLADSRASLVGAALANAVMANALDVDDGYRLAKGHPGAVVFPAALAVAEREGASGRELLEALVVGYEIAIRAGLILHGTSHTFHASGTWGCVGAAAAAARLLGLSEAEVGQALGIAEYHAPNAPLMRDIEHPAMVKDGVSWGSMVGGSAALLARGGFTGVPSLLSGEGHRETVGDLGREFRMLGLYFKPHACCRWAQPAVDGVLQLMSKHGIKADAITGITVHTFEAACRFDVTRPRNTEEAQYSLAFPVAAAAVDGEVGPTQVLEKLTDARILALAEKVEAVLSPEMEEAFPARCLSEVEMHTQAGRVWRSGVMAARGEPDNPLSDDELLAKFQALVGYVLPADRRVAHIIDLVGNIEQMPAVNELVQLIRSR